MIEQEVARQIEFESLDEFMTRQNNFFMWFLDDCVAGNELYRPRLAFKRFQELNPELERDITIATVQAVRSKPRQELPYEQLWEAYKIMSKLVFVSDRNVMWDGQPDARYLCS